MTNNPPTENPSISDIFKEIEKRPGYHIEHAKIATMEQLIVGFNIDPKRHKFLTDSFDDNFKDAEEFCTKLNESQAATIKELQGENEEFKEQHKILVSIHLKDAQEVVKHIIEIERLKGALEKIADDKNWEEINYSHGEKWDWFLPSEYQEIAHEALNPTKEK